MADEHGGVGVVRMVGGEIHIPGHPAWIRGRAAAVAIGSEQAAVVARVHDPPQGYLPGVVHAPEGWAIDPGPGERRSEHGYSEREHGNDDQQFDEGEGTVIPDVGFLMIGLCHRTCLECVG